MLFRAQYLTPGFLDLIIKCCSWFSVCYKDNCKFEDSFNKSNVLRTSRPSNYPVNPFNDSGMPCLPAQPQSGIIATSYGFKWRICFPTSPLSVFITWQQEISKTSSDFTVWISTGTQVFCILLMLYFNMAREVYLSREKRKFINFGIFQTLRYSTSTINLSLKKYL